MAATQQSQALQTINTIFSAAQQLSNLNVLIQQIDASWTDDSVATVIAALQTCPLQADGSLGTPDGTPNAAHPINPASYPALSRANSSNQIAQAKTVLDGIVAYMAGQAVTTQPGARAIINAVVGG